MSWRVGIACRLDQPGMMSYRSHCNRLGIARGRGHVKTVWTFHSSIVGLQSVSLISGTLLVVSG